MSAAPTTGQTRAQPGSRRDGKPLRLLAAAAVLPEVRWAGVATLLFVVGGLARQRLGRPLFGLG